MRTFNLHLTGSDTYRVLVNGQVNPHLVGFYEPWQAKNKLEMMFPGALMACETHHAFPFPLVNIGYFLTKEWTRNPAADGALRELVYYVLRRHAETDDDLLEVRKHLLATVERAEEIATAWEAYSTRMSMDVTDERRQAADAWHALRDQMGSEILIRPIHLVKPKT